MLADSYGNVFFWGPRSGFPPAPVPLVSFLSGPGSERIPGAAGTEEAAGPVPPEIHVFSA